MKSVQKIVGLIAIVAVMGFGLTACGGDDGGGGGGTVSVTSVYLYNFYYDLMAVGGTETLIATVYPANATNKAVTWSTSNSSVATVSNGTVTAVAEGSATITVTTTDGSKTSSRDVTVLPLYNPNAADKSTNIGKIGPGGGMIFYYSASGFTVTGTGSFTANYLEVALSNQAYTTWCTCENTYYGGSGYCNVTTGTAIGTGKANTAAIIAATHPGGAISASNCAAFACKNYTGGDKSDWFLPSIDELDEMYKMKDRLLIRGYYYWSSSQSSYSNPNAWVQYFSDGYQGYIGKYYEGNVRAIRAF